MLEVLVRLNRAWRGISRDGTASTQIQYAEQESIKTLGDLCKEYFGRTALLFKKLIILLEDVFQLVMNFILFFLVTQIGLRLVFSSLLEHVIYI